MWTLWLPSQLVTITASPGPTRLTPSSTSRSNTPTPAVLMKSLSTSPARTTLVSPATTSTRAAVAASRTESSTRSRSASGKPSSSTSERVSQRGTAPLTARSLTVPQTASLPMSPLPKKIGSTTNESVRHRDAPAVDLQHRAVLHPPRVHGAEARRDQLPDQLLAHSPAGAVVELDHGWVGLHRHGIGTTLNSGRSSRAIASASSSVGMIVAQ